MALTVRTPFRVGWGDCDPAGIVFYPRFFAWMDEGAWTLFRSIGLTHTAFREAHGALGASIVDAHCRFLRIVHPGDLVEVESHVSEAKAKTFKVNHVIRKDGEVCCEGHEIRVWLVPDASAPTGVKAGRVPDLIYQQLEVVREG